MKRFCVILILIAVMLTVCGCSQTRVAKNADVTLNFIYGEKNVQVTLEEAEAEKVIAILDGKNYNSVLSGVPSCSFNPDVSLCVGNQVFAIACDTCNCIQDQGNLRYFDIPVEDMEYIHSLFEKHGGFFPCV